MTHPDGCSDAGLVRATVRRGNEHGPVHAAPSDFLEGATSELFMFGTSLRWTVDNQLAILDRLLARNVLIRLLMLDPFSDEAGLVNLIQILSARDNREYRGEVRRVLAELRRHGLLGKGPHLQVRFYAGPGPFFVTGVMCDGDVGGAGAPRCSNGRLCVQPQLKFTRQPEGVVLEFHQSAGQTDGFLVFSREFREYWGGGTRPEKYEKEYSALQ